MKYANVAIMNLPKDICLNKNADFISCLDRKKETLLLTEVFLAVSKINFVVANKTLGIFFWK